MERQRGKDDGEGVLQTGLGQDPGGFIRELVSKECWCWLAESWRYTGYCLLLMVGTAMPRGHSNMAGAAAGMVWQQLGVLQTFVLRLNPALELQT